MEKEFDNNDGLLIVQNITQRYGRRKVLKDITFTAEPGSCIGIIGVNGGGKSTLLTILAGIHSPRSGSVTFQGKNMLRKSVSRHLAGYLPQDDPLMEELTAEDNLRLWYGGKVSSDLPVLTQLQLTELMNMKVRNMSGGMKRRLAIACSVANGQPLLILDEPTSSLDLHQKKIIQDYIREYTKNGGIVILSTHDVMEIRLCTHLYYLQDGTTTPVDVEQALNMLQEGIS